MPEVRLSDTGSPFAWTAADTVKCQLKLSNGMEGTVIASHAAWSGEGFRLEVYGTDGRLVAKAPGYISYSPVSVQGSTRSEPETGMPIPSRFYEVRNIGESSAAFTVSQLLNRFERSVRDRTTFHPDFSDGYRVHTIIETIRKSATTQRWEEIPQQDV
jgi:predicted dehydrogenase